ncbi:AraC family transcriptional regulator [Candidatus Albibeggiatoa sp. nov. NOAA]|uniref:AraC family transcriptional regulator n=1 Tax=Candidatus Albibeggiatoa sp. nov. NOAA TaxID=3162724 RepID=UPI0032FD6C67|nr:AraC family transcriptional regulator [Thiotrichaceae bacterium]
MSAISPYFQQLKAKYAFQEREGFIDTELERVKFFWATETIERAPLIYEAGLVIIGQGHKIGYLGQRTFHYDVDHYLVVSVATPFECATYATPDAPLLGLFIDIDLAELHELVATFTQTQSSPPFDLNTIPTGIEPVALDGDMADAIARLAKCMLSPLEYQVLGHALVKEIIFRALLGQHGLALFALTQHQTHYNRIAKALSRIRQHYAEPLTVNALATDIGMSTSVFHRFFKQITGHSPLQYLKQIRLNQAKSLLLHDRLSVNKAAIQVGYESASQFSREFKRYFGVPPTQVNDIGYQANRMT